MGREEKKKKYKNIKSRKWKRGEWTGRVRGGEWRKRKRKREKGGRKLVIEMANSEAGFP